MASCEVCEKTILFGGKKHGDMRFCSDDCLSEGYVLIRAEQIPPATVMAATREIHQGLCPRCGGNGPVDVHHSHKVWSLILMTQWQSESVMACRSCGRKKQLEGLFFSLIAGWWGFPFGLIVTPVQIVRNIAAIAGGPDPMQPSDAMEDQVRLALAQSGWDEDEKPDA